ncbi:hypothetical protein, partial [Pseudomonas psychrophila]|uniref:hypothetical protein n=1 Tax=Pseudomonas psychrophila TaxID=122355 RepID=UPI00192AC771
DPLGLSSCPGDGGCSKGLEDPASNSSVDDGAPAVPVPHVADKWSREPKSLQDEMTLKAAYLGEGEEIIANLSDPRYSGMYKMELKTTSKNGKHSLVHYVKDPQTGELMDFKFKRHSNDDVKPWGNDPSVPPGGF